MDRQPAGGGLWDLWLASLCVLAFGISAWAVIDAADETAAERIRRQELLSEFEDLRIATDRSLDLEAPRRDERMGRVRIRLRELQRRWSDSPPIPGSEPRLVEFGEREVLVLSGSPEQEPSFAGGPPR